MSYVNLREMLSTATQQHYAVRAFNIVDPMSIQAAEARRSPVIIQTSVKMGCWQPQEQA
ncbi:hypothetical protein CSB45_08035 [candidate division KSB3 bacterium]|uniref:Uncharacterized protein n=1 Tax=candidate division KSB3 bacterium TaxID=2044937 RepID=A0A2G6E4Z6_9BACT|nr:MAG: hypothetical protein CSB45_08035 [candidate division KSB3 bacterium]PIE29829.1 MAG: hypothetical protein CSA57_07185 [candidate division KSB3 bacterium]